MAKQLAHWAWAALLLGSGALWAGPFEDGVAAYSRGDYASALRTFRALAAQGNSDAQSNLGTMYSRGRGVAQDPVRAAMWFSLAAAAGESTAETNREVVERRMSPAQITQARQMARDCQQRNFIGCN
jgi:hypothetical protein